MAFRSQRVLTSYIAGGDARRPDAAKRDTVLIKLFPLPGVAPSSKPAVRIYVGTESAQFRAERAFVWSIMRVRDPARCYEIHLMKDFAGFERRLWLTGFTNYRFAIPELAGGEGRAIYNDTDQIYLKDPALLFDTPMHDHGVLSINDHDTSVMLIDCARMVSLWNWESARNTRNRELETRMRAVPGLWGSMDGAWNARDAEYVSGESAVVHYTTIHTQPWRPFPQDYVYQSNPATDIWLSIEQEADAQNFQLFDAEHRSPAFFAAAEQSESSNGQAFIADYLTLVEQAQSRSLYCGGLGADFIKRTNWPQHLLPSAIEGGVASASPPPSSQVDLAISSGLERLPDLDIPWLLDALFAGAHRAVLVSIDLSAGKLPYCPADPLWWYAQMVATAARYPHIHWRLVVRQTRFPARKRMHRWSGGALLQANPLAWALLSYKTGHASQAVGMADALGWPYKTRKVDRGLWPYLWALLCSRFMSSTAAMPGGIAPPWPDLIIASGWLPSLLARWIARRNTGNTRLILMGRRGGPVGETQDFALHCRHFGLPPHPQHIETLLPPSKVNKASLQAAAKHQPDLYADHQQGPKVILLAGGDSAQYALRAHTAAKLGGDAGRATRQLGGVLVVLPSRRTSPQAVAALRAAIGENAVLEPVRRRAGQDNPYLAYLATADILIVTGESESMLAEAVATGKAVYVYPLPANKPGFWQRISDRVYKQAVTDRFNKRGSRRPQEGLQYLCARLVEYRIFLPGRDMAGLHRGLVEWGVARYFDADLCAWRPPRWRELEAATQRIRDTLRPDPGGVIRSEAQDRRAANA